MRSFSTELWLFLVSKTSQKCTLQCYHGYFLANRDDPSRCTATDCLVVFSNAAGSVLVSLELPVSGVSW